MLLIMIGTIDLAEKPYCIKSTPKGNMYIRNKNSESIWFDVNYVSTWHSCVRYVKKIQLNDIGFSVAPCLWFSIYLLWRVKSTIILLFCCFQASAYIYTNNANHFSKIPAQLWCGIITICMIREHAPVAPFTNMV